MRLTATISQLAPPSLALGGSLWAGINPILINQLTSTGSGTATTGTAAALQIGRDAATGMQQ
jgi:hypothetical protein